VIFGCFLFIESFRIELESGGEIPVCPFRFRACEYNALNVRIPINSTKEVTFPCHSNIYIWHKIWPKSKPTKFHVKTLTLNKLKEFFLKMPLIWSQRITMCFQRKHCISLKDYFWPPVRALVSFDAFFIDRTIVRGWLDDINIEEVHLFYRLSSMYKVAILSHEGIVVQIIFKNTSSLSYLITPKSFCVICFIWYPNKCSGINV